MSLPPYSPGTVMPSTPRSPNVRHRSAGKRLSSSIRAARGAISASAKRFTASRSASMSSPSGNVRMRSPVLESAGPAGAGPAGHSVAAAALEARRRRAEVRQAQLADRRDALLGHAVGRLVGRDAVALADLEI